MAERMKSEIEAGKTVRITGSSFAREGQIGQVVNVLDMGQFVYVHVRFGDENDIHAPILAYLEDELELA